MIEASFKLIDPLNPQIGYELKISRGPRQIFFGNAHPATGEIFRTAQECAEAITMWTSRNGQYYEGGA